MLAAANLRFSSVSRASIAIGCSPRRSYSPSLVSSRILDLIALAARIGSLDVVLPILRSILPLACRCGESLRRVLRLSILCRSAAMVCSALLSPCWASLASCVADSSWRMVFSCRLRSSASSSLRRSMVATCSTTTRSNDLRRCSIGPSGAEELLAAAAAADSLARAAASRATSAALFEAAAASLRSSTSRLRLATSAACRLRICSISSSHSLMFWTSASMSWRV
mmetsp:Transcript_1454/g.4385  ORF Transcript_1454/g.4385 Transcript_1454/m.4385 type:complete len:225 (-) Transcript_1454:1672-2346(-)